jgi:hypothetical protein
MQVQQLKVREISHGTAARASEEPMPPRMALSHFRMLVIATKYADQALAATPSDTGRKFAKSQPRPGAASSKARV